ncbi:rho GTPase-activating protein 22-like isoform X2 [Amphiura filiformis]
MAERTSSIPSDEILYSGYLKKQGGAFRTWQRRWFVLAGEYLYYFNKEEDTRPLGAIPLRNNKVEKHPHNPDDPSKFLFEILPGQDGQTRIIHSHESFLLWAASLQESDEWIQHLRRVIYGRKGGGIFGQSLLDTITNESHTRTQEIPAIVKQCCNFLREKGLQEEGLFRLPGRAALVRELQEQFDCGKQPDFHQQNIDIHTVASLFKLYLRQLPEPVIPWQHYESFYNGIRLVCHDEIEGKHELIRQLALLPRTNYNLLKYICEFLHEVQSYESLNKMGIMNLATVFGPNIFRPIVESTATLMESTAMSQKFVHLLIQQNKDMFPRNNLIDFGLLSTSNGDDEPVPAVPIPPPRHGKGKQQVTQQPSIDLLKELKDNIDNRPPQTRGSLLIDFDSDEDNMQMIMGRSSFAAVNKRSYSVDDALGLRDSMNISQSTLADSSSTLEESGSTDGIPSSRSSRNPSFSDFQDIAPSLKNNNGGNRESLVIFNPSASDPSRPKPKERPASMAESPRSPPPPVSPRKPKPSSMGVDLTSTTPEASARQSMDVAFHYSNMKEQVRALKAELIEMKDEKDQKLLKMKMKCEGLQLKLSNEETLRKAAEERNKQLLSQLNAFIDEYGPQLSSL